MLPPQTTRNNLSRTVGRRDGTGDGKTGRGDDGMEEGAIRSASSLDGDHGKEYEDWGDWFIVSLLAVTLIDHMFINWNV